MTSSRASSSGQPTSGLSLRPATEMNPGGPPAASRPAPSSASDPPRSRSEARRKRDSPGSLRTRRSGRLARSRAASGRGVARPGLREGARRGAPASGAQARLGARFGRLFVRGDDDKRDGRKDQRDGGPASTQVAQTSRAVEVFMSLAEFALTSNFSTASSIGRSST